jgi:hypothetical protein
MMDSIKERLGASDEEWAAIQPRLQNVIDAQRQAATNTGLGLMAFAGGGRGGAALGGRGGRGGDQPQSEVARATQELRTALDNESASTEEVARRLTALREARKKSQAELTAARASLRELLTQRQEAELAVAGILE